MSDNYGHALIRVNMLWLPAHEFGGNTADLPPDQSRYPMTTVLLFGPAIAGASRSAMICARQVINNATGTIGSSQPA
ncbi:MAG: hypothetical protein WAT09_03335 [Paracoccaceae bacterium]